MAGYDDWRRAPAPGRHAPGEGRLREGGRGANGRFGRFDDEVWSSRAVYGPERYGLGPYHERLRRRRRPDDELRRDVQDALFFDTWVDADAITVEVQDGVVTLRGKLPSYEEIRYANDDAWDVEGVVGVQSELELRD